MEGAEDELSFPRKELGRREGPAERDISPWWPPYPTVHFKPMVGKSAVEQEAHMPGTPDFRDTNIINCPI